MEDICKPLDEKEKKSRKKGKDEATWNIKEDEIWDRPTCSIGFWPKRSFFSQETVATVTK